MNVKGFTLIELIAVIVLIAIVGLVASLAIGNYTSYGFSTINDQLDKQLILFAKMYYADNKVELKKPGNKKVSYETLKSSGYITNDMVDYDGNSCNKSYVVVYMENNKYKYAGCIICNDGYVNLTNKMCRSGV